jgi:hypothetical protein
MMHGQILASNERRTDLTESQSAGLTAGRPEKALTSTELETAVVPEEEAAWRHSEQCAARTDKAEKHVTATVVLFYDVTATGVLL